MKLQDIIKTQKQLEEAGYKIKNNLIEEVSVNTIAHFGNVTCFEVLCEDVWAMRDYNNTKNLGYLIRAFFELFELSEEDGLRLSDIKNVPCRLVFTGPFGRCIGFGHFMKDRFVLTEDFAKIDE